LAQNNILLFYLAHEILISVEGSNTMKYEIFDTMTGEVIASYPSEQKARRDQKVFNASPNAAFHSEGFVVRYAVRQVKR
jgi:hypothetical protein